MGRFDILRQIQALDPERDHVKIQHLSTGYEFPWDTVRALEIALYRTYCVPSVSVLLDRTGEFRHRTQQRYDDTAIIVAEMCEWGYESGRGRQALERMNFIHGHFKIANEDYLYVLSTFVYEPIRWINNFGWRKMCAQEKLGAYYFWREVGKRMGIKDIPPTYEDFERYNRDYERDKFRYADTNRNVGSATRDLFASWFPRLFAPLVRYGIYAMLDEPMLEAFGFPRPFGFMPPLARLALKMRGRFVRFLPTRRKPHFFTDIPNRTYPHGYEIADLGPPRLRKAGTV
jgi:ER-bound oxygenase mpaB/B'/Rubber oxygenase, catalytic domain